MASITINEISQTLSYVIGDNSYACVALPITSSWGPGYFDPETVGKDKGIVLENTVWQRFPANSDGLSAFSAAYRGPAANYRLAGDYSYQMAMTLLTAGYDVLTCRLCPGTFAQSDTYEAKASDDGSGGSPSVTGTLTLKAKYPGTFGNNLLCILKKFTNKEYWNLLVYVVDNSGNKIAVENKMFFFELKNATDSIQYVGELQSDFVTLVLTGNITDDSTFDPVLATGVRLGQTPDTAGSDYEEETTAAAMMTDAISYATDRYRTVTDDTPSSIDYIAALQRVAASSPDAGTASLIRYREWLYTNALDVYDLLKDKLTYNPNRVISPGWDDQDFKALGEEEYTHMGCISPLHAKLMNTAYYSRCATAYLDLPRSLARIGVYNESTDDGLQGYSQLLARYVPDTAVTIDSNGSSLFSSHSALFGPWGTYTFVGTKKKNTASPSFLALMIERSMVLNQSLQYEWIQPSSRKNNVNIGKLDYTLPQATLELWQPDPDTDGGVGVNAIANIPEIGISIWGDSTLYENPPATYQALRNLSTRKLVNAIENVVYKVGIGITFNYNNQSAYSKFYVGVTPILDQMRNAGAIEDYKVVMAAGIDAAGQIEANTVVGTIYIVPVGVIQKITVDLICLPMGTDLTNYGV